MGGGGAGEMSGRKRAFMGLRAAIGNFNVFWPGADRRLLTIGNNKQTESN
jgi:hypothetical protein